MGLKNSVTPIKIQKNHAALNEIVDSMTQKVLLNKEKTSDAIKNSMDEWRKY